MREALEKAIKILGGQTAASEQLTIPQPTISFWLNKSKRGIPAEFCVAIEKATRGKVKKEDLRPDIFRDANA